MLEIPTFDSALFANFLIFFTIFFVLSLIGEVVGSNNSILFKYTSFANLGSILIEGGSAVYIKNSDY